MTSYLATVKKKVQSQEAYQARVKQNRFELLSILERTVSNKKMVLETVEPLKEKVMFALMDLATGILVESKEETANKHGEKKVRERVYQKEPNLKALTYMMSLIDVNTAEAAKSLLDYTRSEAAMAEIDSGLAQNKSLSLEGLTEFTKAQLKAFSDSQITEEDFQTAIIDVAYECLQLMMSVPLSSMREHVVSEESYQLFQVNQKERTKLALKRVLGIHGVEMEDGETVEEAN